jgi:hypothetical protein
VKIPSGRREEYELKRDLGINNTGLWRRFYVSGNNHNHILDRGESDKDKSMDMAGASAPGVFRD